MNVPSLAGFCFVDAQKVVLCNRCFNDTTSMFNLEDVNVLFSLV